MFPENHGQRSGSDGQRLYHGPDRVQEGDAPVEVTCGSCPRASSGLSVRRQTRVGHWGQRARYPPRGRPQARRPPHRLRGGSELLRRVAASRPAFPGQPTHLKMEPVAQPLVRLSAANRTPRDPYTNRHTPQAPLRCLHCAARARTPLPHVHLQLLLQASKL